MPPRGRQGGPVVAVGIAIATAGRKLPPATPARLERAAQLGSACAHFAIRQPGTQEYRYTRADLDAVLRRAYGG